MTRAFKGIIKRWTWAATGCGVVLGPGVDAPALAAIWVVGYIDLANTTGLKVDQEFVKGFVGTVFSGFLQWYVSGKIAQGVIAGLAAAGLAVTTASGGLGIAIAAVMMLGSNALINALFTYRFLSISASLLEDAAESGGIMAEGFGNLILMQLMDLSNIPADFGKMFRDMI